MTLITKIAENIHESDAELNQAIDAYLAGSYYYGQQMTAAEWRIQNYELLRRWAYPPVEEYRDAFKADDQLQMKAHADACLAVDLRFPSADDLAKSIEQIRNEVITQIERDCRYYIFYKPNADRRYPLEKQNSLKDIYDDLQRLTERTANQQAALAKLEAVRAWMIDVQNHCFQVEAEILSSDDPRSVAWDFSQFEGSDPNVTIAETRQLAVS